MKLSLLFAAVAFAADEAKDKGCYTCGGNKCAEKWEETPLQACDFTTSSCYTQQNIDKDGKSEFFRGCETNSKKIKEGCVSDRNGAMMCFEACETDKCNGDTDLTPSGAAFTGAAAAALVTLLLA